MIKGSQQPVIRDKIFLLSLITCLLAFFFPAVKISIGGQISTQYLLTSYPGWIVFGVLSIYAVIQCGVYFKKKKWNGWAAALIGLFSAGFATRIIANSFLTFGAAPQNSLANKLAASSKVLPAPLILAIAGLTLFILGVIKIIERQRAITTT